MIDNKKIGSRLEALRKEKKETQTDVAKLLGVQRQVISYYETGARLPNIEDLSILADHYNTTVDYLIGRTETKTVEEDIQMVCNYTGLSEDAIKRLHNCCYAEDTKKVLSFLIAPKSKRRFFDDLLNVSVDLSDYQVKYLEIVRKLSSVEPQIHTLSEKEIEDILDDVEIIMNSAKLSYYDAVEHFRLVVDSFNEFNVKTPENEALVMDCISELNIRLEEYYDGKYN